MESTDDCARADGHCGRGDTAQDQVDIRIVQDQFMPENAGVSAFSDYDSESQDGLDSTSFTHGEDTRVLPQDVELDMKIADAEIDFRRFRTMESAANRLQKESKGYLDSLRAMTASQMRIAETIDAFYGDAGTRDGVSRSYKQAVEDLDAETIKALDGPYRTTVLEPISRFCAYFPDINECIKKRNHKLLDYDAMRAKVKKLVEKPDKDVTKLPRAEKEAEMAKQAYESLNEQLFTELPQLIDLRVPYLDPSFEALVKIQLRFCAEAYSRMAQVQQYLDADTREQYAEGQLDARVEEVLQEIRDLSIAALKKESGCKNINELFFTTITIFELRLQTNKAKPPMEKYKNKNEDS
ncbi:putative bar adaptor protein [Phaeomoniella chlamydospora]|uniref:Putative bar adaptor protein n=1 Tax=Phaeomoniella chlamydospora TaxID=158046 RepID=A0A0G2E1B2_PHACM|nr:putative bar adaptor protein [Phaeomoniella chlamydospora]